MPQEESPEPTEEEISRAVEGAKEQMGEHYESQPTPENINRAMREAAAQFGEEFETGDPAVPEEEIVEKYKKEGWTLVDVIINAAKVSIGHKEGKEIKIVGLGDKFFVFEKKEEEN